ncbi:hypothetical protein FJY71_00560 [candidate division WOR-3 bacterium]|nr:hypothetical protein [candidate division WOR-3 bacterium]
MFANAESAGQLVAMVLPVMVFWFGAGFIITVLYHLSLYYIEGEFTKRDELALDLLITTIRVPLYVMAWPVILFFDRTALHRIALFWRWLDPKTRERDEELQDYLKEREYRQWAARQYEDSTRLALREERELAAGAERRRRLRRLGTESPLLGRIWLLLGVGRSSAGAEQIVRRHPDAVMPDEIARLTREEIRTRRPWNCLRCREPLAPERVLLPEPFFLQVVEGEKPVIEGWAYEGEFRLRYAACAKCGAEQPDTVGPMSSFGRAGEVLAAFKGGMGFAEGAGPEAGPRVEPTWRRPWWARALGLKGKVGLKTTMGCFGIIVVLVTAAAAVWMLWFFITWLTHGVGI